MKTVASQNRGRTPLGLPASWFWDVDPAKLNTEKHAKQIIERVLLVGALEGWKAIRKHYGDERLRSVVTQLRSLSPQKHRAALPGAWIEKGGLPMLHSEAVPPGTLALLKKLCAHAATQGFALVGGTSLALRFGHRISVDLDFFRPQPFDNKIVSASLVADFPSFQLTNDNSSGMMSVSEDAEETETPKTLIKTPWSKVKADIQKAVRRAL